MARVALKDQAAFMALYERTSAKLFGVCLRMLRDRAEAEEALQEVYLKVWQRAGQFAAGRANVMTWLISIARHQAIDMLRARKPAAAELEEDTAVSSPSDNPESHALRASEAARIEACLRELEERHATAVRQAYLEGYSYQELAARFAVPLNTMRTWLRRSLMKLRECLDR